MKKIITMAAATLLVAGSVVAQPKINVSFKMKSNIVSTDFDRWTFLDYGGYGAIASGLLFSMGNDNVGIELEMDPYIAFNSTASEWFKNFSLEKYNAWVSFGKTGSFFLRMGSWDDRAVNCVTDGALLMDGIDFSVYNPGMISSITTKNLSMDISSQCGSSSSKKLGAMFQYKNGPFEIRAGAMNLNFLGDENTGDSNLAVTDKLVFGVDTFMAEIGYTLKNVGRLTATGKFAKEEFALAAFYEPSFPFLKNLTALVGFTGEYKNKNKATAAGKDLWGWGIDFRARYVFDRSISVTTINNFTMNQRDVASGIENGIAMENMVNMLYNVHPRKNDLKVYLNVRHYTGMNAAANGYKPTLLTVAESGNASKLDWVSNFRITNAFEYKFNDNAKLDAGIAFNILNCFSNQDTANDPRFDVQIPLVFQVSF